MALKPDRNVLDWDISKFWHTSAATATRGGVASATGQTGGSADVPSGAAMDQSISTVWYDTQGGNNLSGTRPVGMLMNDVVNVDLTRQILNPNRSEVQRGDKVTLMRKGWAVTNSLDVTTGTIQVGAPAYLGPSGNITAHAGAIRPTDASAPTNHPRVGRFLTDRDEDGYAKVYIDL